MLKNSFIHIPGIGQITEKYFWDKGILSWDDFFAKSEALKFSKEKTEEIKKYLILSKNNLQKLDNKFFSELLQKSEYWRVYPEFKGKIAFLDIETTGLSPFYNKITLIGLYDGRKANIYVAENNIEEFLSDIREYSLIVTYNGSLFDLPFIKKKFPNFEPPLHIDLRFLMKRLGFSGGLKAVERQLGIKRPDEIKDLDGFGATILWHKYTRGDVNSLKLLIEYNLADIINLKILMEKGYSLMRKKLFEEYNTHQPFRCEFSKITDLPSVSVKKMMDSRVRLKIQERVVILDLPKKPKFHISTLLRKLNNTEKLAGVVGIDLSGSEKKASGWASLKEDCAEARLLNTDSEIIDATVQAKPRVISIDSPLSIPEGRCCLNDNCKCRQYGIMRKCEKLLRRRGVPIYPCLIASMQKLTKRGMELAERFKKLGFIVIESYPGAAQDILSIIRKRIDIEELKQGLVDFGIKGNFVNEKNNHDKLDAITSALVGYFYLADDYEAIGNKEEGYLIVPRNPGGK
jgi:uncharacterized protein YprB with RNaseH-like and TPR domain/predicted nuclease with RNAse H fold